jgi:hypothetical protein
MGVVIAALLMVVSLIQLHRVHAESGGPAGSVPLHIGTVGDAIEHARPGRLVHVPSDPCVALSPAVLRALGLGDMPAEPVLTEAPYPTARCTVSGPASSVQVAFTDFSSLAGASSTLNRSDRAAAGLDTPVGASWGAGSGSGTATAVEVVGTMELAITIVGSDPHTVRVVPQIELAARKQL